MMTPAADVRQTKDAEQNDGKDFDRSFHPLISLARAFPAEQVQQPTR